MAVLTTRDFHINGPALLSVRGPTGSSIAGTTYELGLSEGQVEVRPVFNHSALQVNAWGLQPADQQWMGATVDITCGLIHFDASCLEEIVRLSMGGGTSFGQMGRAGVRLGGGVIRFAVGNNYFGLNITSPDDTRPFRFFFCYLPDPPLSWPLGTEKEVINIRFRAVPYPGTSTSILTGSDPGGVVNGVPLGSTNYPLFDRGSDA